MKCIIPMSPEEWIRGTFWASLQALALDPETQLGLYPDGCEKVDELANDFGLHWERYKQWFGRELTATQIANVVKIDSWLSEMSGKTELWTETALRQSSEWQETRRLASVALLMLGWTQETPDKKWF